MNEKALHIYKSTFLVELTREKSIEHTYGFVVNEGTRDRTKINSLHTRRCNNERYKSCKNDIQLLS